MRTLANPSLAPAPEPRPASRRSPPIARLLLAAACAILAEDVSARDPARAERIVVDNALSPLNHEKLAAPEGIAARGEAVLVSQAGDSRIMRIGPDGKLSLVVDLAKLPGGSNKSFGLGLALDSAGNLYIAARKFRGGALLRAVNVLAAKTPLSAADVHVVRERLGSPNGLALDERGGAIYVSDSGPVAAFGLVRGGIYRITLDGRDGASPRPGERIASLRFPNGLALSHDRTALFIAQTYAGLSPGGLYKLDLTRPGSSPERLLRLGGWPDGLLMHPRESIAYLCLQKRGEIARIDLASRSVQRRGFHGRDGRCAPASLAWRDDQTLLFTDIWEPSLPKILLKRWHHHAYAVPVAVIAESGAK